MPKVLYIGFGITPFVKGGAVIYQEALIEAISANGWETTCFFSAPRYTRYSINEPYLKTWHKNNIKFIELCNPPYLLGCQNNPIHQCSHGNMENLAMKVLDDENPDIVHFHELQMHPASMIDIVSDKGIPSLKTIHNYYDICPQRDLMYKGKEPCLDFKNGEKCTECLALLPVSRKASRKRILRTLLPERLCRHLSSFYKKIKHSGNNNKQTTIQHNNVTPYASGIYLNRRKFFVERLNKLNALHCSSSRSADIFINCGVLKEKIKIMPLSAKSIDQISPKSLRGGDYPVTFGYISGKNLSRGYQVLIDAFSMLDQNRAKLIVWGMSKPETSSERLNVEFRKPYKPGQINQILREIDVGIIPSIWEEVFGIIGIEWLTARVPVIGSDIGGIPTWLKDGENGFLVPPNNVHELAKKMGAFVENPELIAQIQQQTKPWKSFNEHIKETTTLYEQIIANQTTC